MEKQIKEKKLENKVFLKGFVKEASTYLKAFDVFLLPSLSEAFPYTILEAGFAEMPVIATAVGGIPEIIKNEETGMLIRPKNPKEIANAIKFLSENKEKRDILAQKLHEQVVTNFTLEKMLAGIEKTLAEN